MAPSSCATLEKKQKQKQTNKQKKKKTDIRHREYTWSTSLKVIDVSQQC